MIAKHANDAGFNYRYQKKKKKMLQKINYLKK